MKKKPDVVMWRGMGLVSSKGFYLEAYGDNSKYVLHRYAILPKGHQFVMVTARLEFISAKQVRTSEDLKLGFVEPTRKVTNSKIASSKIAAK